MGGAGGEAATRRRAPLRPLQPRAQLATLALALLAPLLANGADTGELVQSCLRARATCTNRNAACRHSSLCSAFMRLDTCQRSTATMSTAAAS
eukprot:357859-Chlamydomonas_euryale.AAC.1